MEYVGDAISRREKKEEEGRRRRYKRKVCLWALFCCCVCTTMFLYTPLFALRNKNKIVLEEIEGDDPSNFTTFSTTTTTSIPPSPTTTTTTTTTTTVDQCQCTNESLVLETRQVSVKDCVPNEQIVYEYEIGAKSDMPQQCLSFLYDEITFKLFDETALLIKGEDYLQNQTMLQNVPSSPPTFDVDTKCSIQSDFPGEYSTFVKCTNVRIESQYDDILLKILVHFSTEFETNYFVDVWYTWTSQTECNGLPVAKLEENVHLVTDCGQPTPSPSAAPSVSPTPAPSAEIVEETGACCSPSVCYDHVSNEQQCLQLPFGTEFLGSNTSCFGVREGIDEHQTACNLDTIEGCCQFDGGNVCTSSIGKTQCELISGVFTGGDAVCNPESGACDLSVPTPSPSTAPSPSPTVSPTFSPTSSPTPKPIAVPTRQPTSQPATPQPTPPTFEIIGACCSTDIAEPTCFNGLTEEECDILYDNTVHAYINSTISCLIAVSDENSPCTFSAATEIQTKKCCAVSSFENENFDDGLCTNSLSITNEECAGLNQIPIDAANPDQLIQEDKLCDTLSRTCQPPCSCDNGNFNASIDYLPGNETCVGDVQSAPPLEISVPLILDFEDQRGTLCSSLFFALQLNISFQVDYEQSSAPLQSTVAINSFSATIGEALSPASGVLLQCTPSNAFEKIDCTMDHVWINSFSQSTQAVVFTFLLDLSPSGGVTNVPEFYATAMLKIATANMRVTSTYKSCGLGETERVFDSSLSNVAVANVAQVC